MPSIVGWLGVFLLGTAHEGALLESFDKAFAAGFKRAAQWPGDGGALMHEVDFCIVKRIAQGEHGFGIPLQWSDRAKRRGRRHLLRRQAG